ncbi:hypothetical protein [Streptomyces sp. NPDC001843]|uniref:hypothetical protein n=1 Tax=Streptomyces sp. NPDC001843 TaxID=3364617 RepID=UPI0036CE4413
MTDEQIRVEQTLDAWERIESWLREHAPSSYAALPPAAEPSAVQEAENTMGPLPPELRALWEIHDGTSQGLLRGYDLFSVAGCTASRSMMEIVLDDLAGERPPWVQALATDTTDPFPRDFHFIDVRTGRLGWYSRENMFIPPEESEQTLSDRLEDVAEQLEAGGTQAVSDGRLTW